MSDAFIGLDGGGTLVDYRRLRVGDPAGSERVIRCTRCGESAIAHGRSALHVVKYYQTPSGKIHVEKLVKCSGGYPKPAPESGKQTGLPWCPKEWL